MKRFWRLFIAEPFVWIFLCFFQPSKFERDINIKGYGRHLVRKRLVLMLQLTIPLFLCAYPFALLIRAVLYQVLFYFHMTSFFQRELIFQAPLTFQFFILTASAAYVGLMFGFIGGVFGGLRAGIIVGIIWSTVNAISGGNVTLAIGLGMSAGIASGFLELDFLNPSRARGIWAGIGQGAILSVAPGNAWGSLSAGVLCLLFSFAIGLVRNPPSAKRTKIAFFITFGLFEGIQFGLAGVLQMGLPGYFLGVCIAVLSPLCYLLGDSRLPFYPIVVFSTIRAYFASKKEPTQVFVLLHRSALYWDERGKLPLPRLKQILFLAGQQNIPNTLKEFAFILTERPHHLRVVLETSWEIALHNLETRTELAQIAQASLWLAEVFPQAIRLLAPSWFIPLKWVNEASLDAARAISPIGKSARIKTLEEMILNLQSVHPDTAFPEEMLNKRLASLTCIWIKIAQSGLDEIQQFLEGTDYMENPYNPGNALKPHDPLFVGRRDLVLQLERALNKESRPTFFLNGERRLGKSSALMQLPYLLGSQYIPIFYNMQNPGIFATASTLIGTIAEGIYREMHMRGFQIEALTYEALHDAWSKQSSPAGDAQVYHMMNQWLQKIELGLKQTNRTLLLLFDEFEKFEDAELEGYIHLAPFLDWLRSIIQYHPCIVFLFSGVHTLSEMGTNTKINWARYFVNVQVLKVSFLKPEEAHTLITQPIKDFLDYEVFGDDVVNKIIEVTNGHPFLVQALCSALIDYLNVEKRNKAQPEDVIIAIDEVIENWGDTYFRDLWDRINLNQRTCLLALKRLKRGTLQKLVLQCGQSEKVTKEMLHALQRRSLVVQENGKYRIATLLFEKWIRQYA